MTDRKEYFSNYRKKNKEKIIENRKNYYINNKKEILDNKKEYRDNNKEKIAKQKIEYYNNNKNIFIDYYNNNKNEISQKKKIYYIENKDKIVKDNVDYITRKYKEDALFRLNMNIRNLIRYSFKNKGYKKNQKTILILGCSFKEFKEYVEKQFEPWMNWYNYGLYNGTEKYGWDIDHIIGLKEGKSEEEIIKLNHYTNLRPLCSYYNRNIKR